MVESPTLRKVCLSVLAVAVIIFFLSCTVGVSLVISAWSALARIQVDPEALSKAVKDGVMITLKDGLPEQKLEMIRTLREMGAGAREFIPALSAAAADDDPRVRTAAAEAAKQIESAADKAGLK